MGNVKIGLNMAVKNLQTKVQKDINTSGLPISVCHLVLKDIVSALEKASNEAVKVEFEEYERRMKDGESVQSAPVREQTECKDTDKRGESEQHNKSC